jgi:hypothetical protein
VCRIQHGAMKRYESAEAQTYTFLPSELDDGEWSVSWPGQARPRESFQHTLDKMTAGLPAIRKLRRKENLCPVRRTSDSPVTILTLETCMTVNQTRRKRRTSEHHRRLRLTAVTFMFLTGLSFSASRGYSDRWLATCPAGARPSPSH